MFMPHRHAHLQVPLFDQHFRRECIGNMIEHLLGTKHTCKPTSFRTQIKNAPAHICVAGDIMTEEMYALVSRLGVKNKFYGCVVKCMKNKIMSTHYPDICVALIFVLLVDIMTAEMYA